MKKKTNNSLLLFLTLIFPFLHASGQFSISGSVVDDANNPIELANVILRDSDGFTVKGTVTDEIGGFKLDYAEKCNCKISISYLGYEVWSQLISDIGNIELGTVKLVEKESELKEIVISSKKRVIKRVGKKIVFDVENSKDVSGLDGLEILKFAPRIDPTSDCPSVFGKDYTLIYINGRPSNQPSVSMCKYLATIRSDQIKKIEVITTPSAKLDAEGNKAIINIVLKEKSNIGFDGSTSIQYKQRTFPTYWPSISLTYSSKKISTSLNASYFNEKQNNQLTNNIFFDKSLRISETNTTPHIKGFLSTLNLDYKISSKTNIGLRLSSNFSENSEKSDTKTTYYNSTSKLVDSTFALPSTGNLDYKYYGVSIYSDFKLDTLGSKFKISANNLKRVQNDSKALQSTIFSNNTSNIVRSESALNNSNVDYQVNSILADFEISRPKTKWEFGGKATLVNNDSDISFFKNSVAGIPVLDSSQSNNFLYDETILAAYLSFDSYHWNKWFLQLGLRFENTKTKGKSITLNEKNDTSYNYLFPSAYVSYNPNNNHSFSIGYSTSITRPRFYSVNPFRTYVDFFSYSEGNPRLLPSYTHSLEFSYILKNNLSFFVSNIFTNDSFDYLTLTSELNNLEITRPQNYFDQYTLGLDVRYNWRPRNWFNNRFSLNWSYSKSISSIPNITLPRLNGSGLALSSSSLFTIDQKKENKIYLRISQNLPSTDGFINTRSSAEFTLGSVFHFLNKNLILQIQLKDIFKQKRIIAVENYQNYRYESKTYNDVRAFTLMLTYKFGNKKSIKRQRNVDQSEQNRMN